MTRAVGIDPGTVSIDVCGLVDGRLYLDRSWSTEVALAKPEDFVQHITELGMPDLVAGPSGYGLPLVPAATATDADLRLAFLAAPDEPGGIGGLRQFARLLGASGLPVIYTPGVIHLDTVPEHRKLNRVDLGTADKLSAAVLGIQQESEHRGCSPEAVYLILEELGGALTGGVALGWSTRRRCRFPRRPGVEGGALSRWGQHAARAGAHPYRGSAGSVR